jgi:Ca-activated chloride channel family protein
LDFTTVKGSNALLISTPDKVRQAAIVGAAADPNIAASPQMQNTMKLMGLLPEETGGAAKETRKEEPQQFVVLTPEEAAEQEQEAARALEPAQPEQVEQPAEEPGAIETTQGAVFKEVPVNPFVLTENDKFSTFAIDVDTASYALSSRYIKGGYLPPRGAVRMEEFVNAFDYNYPRQPQNVFNVYTEAMPSPFGQGLVLLKVGIMGKVVGREARKPANLVFVIDASGSMDKPDRLPLVRFAIEQLVNVLEPDDRVSLITYGTHANLVLENVPASDRDTIIKAVDAIQTSGSTNMLEGIRLGYEIAQRTYREMTESASQQGVVMKGVMSRVMLLSDGVANIGTTDAAQILKDVEQYKNFGITFSSAGFGMGSYNDTTLEQLSNKGDGSYVFVGSKGEAKRVFGEEMSANLQTIAKDAKIQVEFNPTTVRRYRLVGYENRDIADKDFRNDAIDAGEVGSGQSVTALYELELLEPQVGVRPGDIGTVFVRYRNMDTKQIEEISSRMAGDIVRRYEVSENPRFYLAAAVAEFAELLRESEHAKSGNLPAVESMLRKVAGALTVREQGRLVTDPKVSELIYLVKRAQGLPRAQ